MSNITSLDLLTELPILSKEDLMNSAVTFVHEGRKVVAILLAHLVEVVKRELDAKYASLASFCVKKLGMTPGEARPRAHVARLAREYPSIIERVARGEIHLSGVLALHKFLDDDNHEELLDAAAGKSTREIRAMLAERFPEKIACKPPPVTKITKLSSTHVRIAFTATVEFRAKLDRLVALIRRRGSDADLPTALEAIVEPALAILESDEQDAVGVSAQASASPPSATEDNALGNARRVRRAVQKQVPPPAPSSSAVAS